VICKESGFDAFREFKQESLLSKEPKEIICIKFMEEENDSLTKKGNNRTSI